MDSDIYNDPKPIISLHQTEPHILGRRRSRLGSKSLPTTRTQGIEIRPLTQTDSAGPRALAESLVEVIRGRGMVHAAIIPDGQVVRVLPAEADLEVVVLDDELHEPVEEVPRLRLGQPVDALDVVADGEHALPPRHRVRADYRVDRFQHLAYVLGRPARRRVYLEVVPVGRLVEGGLCVVRGQCVQEAPQRLRDAVVELVARGPEGVCSVGQ